MDLLLKEKKGNTLVVENIRSKGFAGFIALLNSNLNYIFLFFCKSGIITGVFYLIN